MRGGRRVGRSARSRRGPPTDHDASAGEVLSGAGDGSVQLYVFDDRVADGWAPFSLSRPCSELLFGRWTLRERWERAAGRPATGLVSRPSLGAFSEAGAPPVVDPATLNPSSARIFLSVRAVPAAGVALPSAEGNLWVDGVFAGLSAAPGTETPDRAWFADPAALPGMDDIELEGTWLEAVWDLIAHGPARLEADLAGDSRLPDESSELPPGVERIGEGAVRLAAGVRIEPGVLFDTRSGAVELDAEVEVRTGARLEGPLYAGPRSRLLGGSMSATAAGPLSYLRGEIEECTVLGYANKAHDGFLGHAYVGRWVNLGAMTTNSDLKNNYGTVRVGPPGAEVDTGLVKLGCLIGDHAKTGIGVLLNTGTVVGAGSNVFGDAMPPKWVPPFSWGSGTDLVEYRRDAFLATAATVMGRRGVETGDRVRAWLADVWDEGRR